MDDTPQLDGSDAAPGASTQAQLVSALKLHLKSALLILDAFDQLSFSNLSTDNEYKDSVQRLLSPLTTLSLSSVVDQANEVLRSGLDAISARMSAIVHSPHPSTVAQRPLLRQSANASTIPIPRPNPTSHPRRVAGQPPLAPPLPQTLPSPQLSPLATVQNDTSKAQDMMISIHFLAGCCRPDANMGLLVTTLNWCVPPLGYFANPPQAVVAEARKSTNGDRIVLGIVPGTFKMDDLVSMIQELNLVLFCSPGSVTHVRRGGTVEYVLCLENVSLSTIDAYSGELIHQTESYLMKSWGQGIKLVKKMSPFIYLCEGPTFALDRFCSAPKGSFDLVIDILPGRRKTLNGITVEGLCLFDVFDFV